MSSSDAAHSLEVENQAFVVKAESALRELFDKARDANELQFVLSLVPEMRGSRAAGWNTATEAQQAFVEYREFLNEPPMTPLKARIALAFYCHMAEASGLYEVPKNMLRVAGGGFHNPWPFDNLVKVHQATGSIIAPNANKILRDLAGHSRELGMLALAEVFRDAFDADLRNGYSHADYVVWDDGIRLPRRNGGNRKLVTWSEFAKRFGRGLAFFDTLRGLGDEYMRSYAEPRHLSGAWADGRPSRAMACFDIQNETFSISDSSP